MGGGGCEAEAFPLLTSINRDHSLLGWKRFPPNFIGPSSVQASNAAKVIIEYRLESMY